MRLISEDPFFFSDRMGHQYSDARAPRKFMTKKEKEKNKAKKNLNNTQHATHQHKKQNKKWEAEAKVAEVELSNANE